jgi:HD-GYP domain-containing protein (c-di-GMP phosphodiesterase class II)
MVPLIAGLAAAGVSALLLRERRRRRVAERLSAATLETLLNAVDANDSVTGAHVRRVAAMSLVLAEAAGLDEHERSNVERVALFHDVGKIHAALFDILHDSARLTPDERRAVATHPGRGGEVLAPLEAFYPSLRDGVVAHHERWDGTGYPNRLEGTDIPLAARIVAIADAFDAITHSRRYNTAKSDEAAIEALQKGRGTQFDPELVDLLLTPPVLDEVRRARQRALHRRARGSRRQRRHAGRAPDIRFRWRTPELSHSAREPSPGR